jgi:ubiquinone/menaquinone biosynthesis C-methylase UbiE
MSHLKEFQYNDSSNYNERIYLHYKFGTKKYPWPLWVFDNIKNEKNLKVLELGSGNGLLWRLNAHRIPDNWHITASDFSDGMLQDTKKSIGNSIDNICYEVIDAENIPYDDNYYDIIIANHMLYHVPNKRKALAEIRRVLKRDGIFYASTMRSNYMKEMIELIKDYRAKPHDRHETNPLIANFSIENGKEQLKDYFNEIALKIYENSLIINEAEPFINFIYSCNGINEKKVILEKDERGVFLEFLKAKIKKTGDIVIPTDCGLFICRNTV